MLSVELSKRLKAPIVPKISSELLVGDESEAHFLVLRIMFLEKFSVVRIT